MSRDVTNFCVYEIKKKVVYHTGYISGAWHSFWPPFLFCFGLVKWAENKYHHELLSHRD